MRTIAVDLVEDSIRSLQQPVPPSHLVSLHLADRAASHRRYEEV